jgi:hypothetical protein
MTAAFDALAAQARTGLVFAAINERTRPVFERAFVERFGLAAALDNGENRIWRWDGEGADGRVALHIESGAPRGDDINVARVTFRPRAQHAMSDALLSQVLKQAEHVRVAGANAVEVSLPTDKRLIERCDSTTTLTVTLGGELIQNELTVVCSRP